MHEMTVYGFTVDSIANMPVVILKDAEGENTVPIWISPEDAVSIAAELIKGDISSKSGRNDLMFNLLERVGLTLAKVVVEDIKDSIFEFSVRFVREGEEIKVDVKPSEALVISLRSKLPVLISEELLARASTLTLGGDNLGRETNARRFVDFLENLNPEEMGKYPM